jgi:hypothetical protein
MEATENAAPIAKQRVIVSAALAQLSREMCGNFRIDSSGAELCRPAKLAFSDAGGANL